MAGYHFKGKKRYTDGATNVTCFPGDEPAGFRPGLTAHHTEQGREMLSRRVSTANRKRWARMKSDSRLHQPPRTLKKGY